MLHESGSSERALPVVRTIQDLRAQVAGWRAEGLSVGLVPTLGALHEGHLSLIRIARQHSDRVVVSIFLNPTQFVPGEDLDKYPKQEVRDRELAGEAGAHLAFAPPTEEVYPPGFSTMVRVNGISEGLCGAHRPGHFDGVALVVTKLLLQCLPDAAVFGEKDYQQLCVIRRLTADLDIPVRILAGPTIRDDHGLALSSRNAYLTEATLPVARQLNVVLRRLADGLRAEPDGVASILERGQADIRQAGFETIDYLELRAIETLQPLLRFDRPGRLLTAARVGGVRLIDNVPVEPA